MQINEFLTRARIPIRIACITNTGWPTVVSLWYIYKNDTIFCATRKNAKILQYLKGNSKCGFEIAGDTPPYKGIRGHGVARMDESIGGEILRLLIDKYLRDHNSSLAINLIKNVQEEVAIEIKPSLLSDYDYSSRMKNITIERNI